MLFVVQLLHWCDVYGWLFYQHSKWKTVPLCLLSSWINAVYSQIHKLIKKKLKTLGLMWPAEVLGLSFFLWRWSWVCFFQIRYCNLLKMGPPSKKSPPPFLNEVVAFLLKVHPPSCGVVHAVKQEALKKQYTVRGGTNKWRQTPLILHKPARQKRHWAISHTPP